jgi:glyoxylase I family protein
MDIYSINHVSVLVSDTDRALEFYHRVLGLPIDQSRPRMTFPGAWLSVGAAQLHLIETGPEPPLREPSGYGGRDYHLALGVRDLDAVKARLDAVGIHYRQSSSGRRALFCRDPDGNAIELVEGSSEQV